MPQLVESGLETGSYEDRPAWFDLLSSILKPRTKFASDVIEKARFLYEGDEVTFDEKSVAKNLAKEGARSYLEAARATFETLGEWKAAAIDAALDPLPDQLGVNKRKFYGAVRVAECGNQVSPPLGESLELLGKDVALARLERALPMAL